MMLSQQVALVTGAGRGIGREVSLALARQGAAVGLVARTPSELAETAALIEQVCNAEPPCDHIYLYISSHGGLGSDDA